MDATKAKEYLNSFDLFMVDMRLDRIKGFLEHLGNPQKTFSSVIVAGTNGKGSTACFLSSILTAGGKKTALYLSPHVRSLNERIQVDGKEITDQELSVLVEKLKKAKEEQKSDVSYFEFLTALAFTYFKEKGCEFAVLETGMGGRLDATNVVPAELEIITNISLEHTKYLGNTLEKIAAEKAGVIKEGSKVLTGALFEGAREVIERTAAGKNAELIALGRDFSFEEKSAGLEGQEFNFIRGGKTMELETKMAGKKQFCNAALAVAAALELGIKERFIHNGLLSARLPARFEVFSANPPVILDVAHNPAGMSSLRENLENFFPGKSVRFVLGVSDDKDIKGVLSGILPVAGEFILTRAEFRGMDTEKIALALQELGFSGKVEIEEKAASAVNAAMEKSGGGMPTVFTGSFFSVGEALAELEKN